MEEIELSVEMLQSKVSGQVLTAGSEDYDTARTPWDLSVVQYPKVIVLAESVEDILQAVDFARDHTLQVAATNTGHGIALPADNNMLIDVSLMNEVKIDTEKQTAWIEAGAKWSHVLDKAQNVGLAPLMGSSTDTGAIGYTLGGGMGWLARKFGLSVDNVLSYDIVTANGKCLHVSKDENQDLFWGLSGAGAAFGLVTAMEIRLFPVDTVYAGSLMYPSENAREVFTRYKEVIKDLDNEWTTSIMIMNLPNLPFIPEVMQGKSVIMLHGCSVCSAEEGFDFVDYWLNWEQPMENHFQTMPFRDIDKVSDDPKEPSASMATNIILKELSKNVIDILIDKVIPEEGQPTPLLIAQVHQVGGAVAEIDKDAMAFSQHDAPLILKLLGTTPTPETKAAFREIADSIRIELQPYSQEGVYLNFLTGDEKWNRTKQAFPASVYDKLIYLKKEYDPENMFAFGLNIPTE